MYVNNIEKYKDIQISELGFSARTYNCLMRAGFKSLYLLIENYERLYDVRNMGAKSIKEIENVLSILEEKGLSELIVKKNKHNIEDDLIKDWTEIVQNKEWNKLPETILGRPATDLNISVRIRNAFLRSGIDTIRQVVSMSEYDVQNMRNMGELSVKQLKEQLEMLYEKGEDYFQTRDASENIDIDISENSRETHDDSFTEKKFDYDVIDVLDKQFNLKISSMAEWFGLSRQSIYNILEKKSPHRQGIWTGKELTDYEYEVIHSMIKSKRFEYSDNIMVCYCINDRQSDLACLFIYEDEIKCFFLKDLPRELQEKIIKSNYHRYTERELSGEVAGKIVHIITKPYFIPAYPDKFRANAQLRGMTSDEYSVFISGYHIGDQRSVTDDQITTFFDENMIDGKVYISSDPKNQWIRSLASRNGYAIKDFVELFGYESKLDGTELTTDGARERHKEELKQYLVRDNVVYFPTYSRIYRVLHTYTYNKGITINEYLKEIGFVRTTERPDTDIDIIEKDMEVRQSNGNFEDKIFAKYPLIGSKILKAETLDKLNEYSRNYIDTVLKEPWTKLPLRAEMQITLALINNAKSWKSEENSNFWNYIALRFGYRDASGSVVRILQSSLESAMKTKHRLFIEDSNGRAFKSTAVIHAFTTRKSWMALFDFLFDFYKNNLKWKFIPEDPIFTTMIQSLQKKLSGDENEDTELTISSSVYSFQEGIRKLILFRPVFTRGLFEKFISKIDTMVNSKDKQTETYEDYLCEEWFKEKITAIANTKRSKRQGQVEQREVAIDYSRIRAKYVLKNETDIQLVLPDIRMKCEEINKAVLFIYYNGSMAYQQNMSWYGNELGKTLNGVSLSLPMIPVGIEVARIQVKIICDNEEIYNSEETLYRRFWVFYGDYEYNADRIKKGNYTLILPRESVLKMENVEEAEIDRFMNSGLHAFFLGLKEGYVVMVNGNLIAFDSETGTEIRVIVPSESMTLPRVEEDELEYYFAYQNSVCNIILGSLDYLQKFIILCNGEQVEFSSLSSSENKLVFTIPLSSNKDICRIQVINLSDERLKFDRSFIIVKQATCSFNKEFYFLDSDYYDAEYRVEIDDFSEKISFDANTDEVRIPFRNGELHVIVPKIVIQETSGAWMNGSALAWYIDDIPQSSLLKVSTPPNLEVKFLVGGKDIMYDGKGLVTIGNVLHSFRNNERFSLVDVEMKVSGLRQDYEYPITKVCYKERFIGQPKFWTEEHKLYWNHGGTFIGKAGRTFKFSLIGENNPPVEFDIDENTDYVVIPEDMPIGNYRYEISITIGNLFKKTKEVIAEGDCVVGDQNLLRFIKRRIIVDSITDELNESLGHIQIRTCYIDKIEFKGIEDTSEGHCPVYSGVMYTIGYHGERYDFSFDRHTNKRGITKIMVNPVRIVFISDNAICITDSDNDGLYYYSYYDKYLEKTVYALTDRQYTKAYKHKYSVADLYLYRTERI